MSKEHFCYECDTEFTVVQVNTGPEVEESISFCPYCGSEMDLEEEDDDLDEEYYEEDE